MAKEKELKMRPTEWARQDKIDHHLFLHWKDTLMTYNEYTKIKNSVYRGENK